MNVKLLCSLIPMALFALPHGEKVHRGEARVERGKGSMTIYAQDGSIIHYQGFNIAHGEQVQFIQPDGTSRVLNRIQGALPTQIDGKLFANGQIYLMNPAGVIFGAQAIVNVGKLFAGAARISDSDFLSKKDAFYDLHGTVINQGLLKGEEIHLIGKEVENHGTIEGSYSTLLSGKSVLIGHPDGGCFVSVEPSEEGSEMIGASDFVGLAIWNSGQIAAKEVHIEGDRVLVQGSIVANGDKGGNVRLLGNWIDLKEGQISAVGDTGGGTVLVGGDYQGKGDLRKSHFTSMDGNSVIDVSAKSQGDGGTAILWSEGTTLFEGKIFARGGSESGHGGFVETSGKVNLGCNLGYVNALAPFGKAGDWMIDPLTITIMTGGGCTLATAAMCALGGACVIDPVTINAAAANVLLCAMTTIVQNLGETINIPMAGVGITFQAGVSTTLNANVTTNGGDIISTTSPTTIEAATLSSGAGNITLADLLVGVGAPGVTLQVGAGNLTITGNTTLSNDLNLISTAGGTISAFNVTGAADNLTINGGPTGAVIINGNTDVDTLTVTDSLSTNFIGTTMANTVVLTDTTGAIDFGLAVTIGTITTTTNGYSVIFEDGGTVTNPATFSNTGGVQFGNAATSNITFTGGVNTNQAGVTTSTFGTVNTTGTAMTLGPVILLGNTTMNTMNGALTFNGSLTGPHNLTVNTGTTAPLFVGPVSIGDVVGNVSLTINTTGANTIFQNTLTTVGGLTSNNNVVFNNNVSIGGVTSLPSLTTSVVPLANYNIAFIGGGTVTAFTNFLNLGTVTFGGPTFPTMTFPNGVSTGSGPSMTFVQGTVNVTGAGAPLTFGNTTFNAGNNTVTTNNGLMTIGNVTLTGNASLQTGGANLVVGNVNGAGNLATTSGATGTTTIASLVCGTFSPSNSLSVTITGPTTASTVNLTGMAGGQAVTFNGLVNISTQFLTSAAAYSITFNAGGVVTPFTNFFNTGGVNFGNSTNSSINFVNGLDTFFPGVNTNLIGLLQSTLGPISMGPLVLVGNSTVQAFANPITFHSTINGNFALTVNDAGGAVVFDAIVGGVTPLNSLTVNAGSIDLQANQFVQGGPMVYNGPVILTNNVTLSDTGSQGISFRNTIDGAFFLTLLAPNTSVSASGAVGSGTALTGLTVTAGGTTTFGSSVNTSGSGAQNAGNITITSGGSVFMGGLITAIGNGGFNGGNVSITSSGGSISTNSIDVSGGNSGNITLQPASGFTSGSLGNLPQGTLELVGTLTALGSGGSSGTVSLAPAGRSTTMSVATIFGDTGGSDLTVNAGELIIGHHEAMTILGNINLNIQGTAAVGDIIALDSLTINAGTLQLNLYEGGNLLDYQGELYPSSGLHLFSRNTSVNAGSITTTGSGPAARIDTLEISRSFLHQLLLFGDIVLNLDPHDFPISGIISWVLPADTTWDTTPLPEALISWWQVIELRLNRTLRSLPNLRGNWGWVSKWSWIKERTRNGLNPVQEALFTYIERRGHRDEIISLPDFLLFLREEKINGIANAYIGNVASFVREIGKNRPEQNGPLPPKSERTLSPAAAYYFTEDLMEYTKPGGLTLGQWREIIDSNEKF